MDSGMRSISNYDSMPYTIVTSLEMSDEPYKSMKPYIAVADKVKADAMKLFDK